MFLRTVCLASLSFVLPSAVSVQAATLRVPRDHASIQAAIDAAAAGDVVLVSAGTYRERVRLKSQVTLKSDGDDVPGKLGLNRAEGTILDGGGAKGDGPGVAMAEGATLDGFTITNVGVYDEAEWQKHQKTQGNQQPHEHIGEPGVAGIGIAAVTCEVRDNIVHHIGYSGIAIQGESGKRCSPRVYRNVCYRNMGGGIGSMKGSTAIVEANICFQNFYAGIGHDGASPLVIGNTCYENIRAGIGVSEGACPVVRGNKCYRNRRAGIGIRTGAATKPLVEQNECFENDMAGIGCDEHCEPIVRGNDCHHNVLAGIGCREGARPLLVDNHVHHNQASGIGFAACENGVAIVVNNRVHDNAAVSIGIQSGWNVRLERNELTNGEGLPPVVMVFQGATADFSDNTLRGGGVAAIRGEGTMRATNNRLESTGLRAGGGPPQFALWALPGADIVFEKNTISGWRHAVSADKARVVIRDNRVTNYGAVGIKVDQPVGKAIVSGNRLTSKTDRAGVAVTGTENAVVEDNVVSAE